MASQCNVVFLTVLASTLLQLISQFSKHEHTEQTVGLGNILAYNLQENKVTAFGWISVWFDKNNTPHFDLPSKWPILEFVAFLFDVIVALVLLIAKCCRTECDEWCYKCCSDCCSGDDDRHHLHKHIAKNAWTPRKKTIMTLTVLGALLKFVGCIWYVISAPDSKLFWCAVESSFSMVLEVFSLIAMGCALQNQRPW